MKIKVEPYLMKKGNRVAKAAIEFEQADGVLAGFNFIGFTICEDRDKELFVLFPSSVIKSRDEKDKSTKPYFFLRPDSDEAMDKLEDAFIKVYEDMMASTK